MVKDIVSHDIVEEALALAEKCDGGDETLFASIHSKTEGEVGRVILGTTDAHLEKLRSNEEAGAYIGEERDAIRVHSRFTTLCEGVACDYDLTEQPFDTSEFVKNEPNSQGQNDHMDNWQGVWVMMTPLVSKCAITCIKHQTYQDYPENRGPNTRVPRNWASLADIPLTWEVGDLLVMRSNCIHAGPPTGDERRFLLFASEQSSRPGEYTDTKVILEADFFADLPDNS